MSDPYLGQIILIAGSFAPQGWHICDGSAVQIRSNTALFSLLGTTYGGDGVNTFNLPDLRGRVAVGTGSGPGLSGWSAGQQNGTENVTLNTNQIPSHNHTLVASTEQAGNNSPANSYLGEVVDSTQTVCPAYTGTLTAANMNGGSIAQTGGGQAHTNIQPSLGLNYCIALQGIYPSRN